MIVVVSPSKTQNFTLVDNLDTTQLRQSKETFELIRILKNYRFEDIKQLMKLSDNLSALNFARFQAFEEKFEVGKSKQALWAFQGDVYSGIDVSCFDQDDIEFVQSTLRMLCGLYGVVRPLDLIQPYRLEMGIRLKNSSGDNLYKYWGDMISKVLNLDNADVLLNLASNEYFKGIDKCALKATIVNAHFKEWKVDKYKIVAIHAKRARGMMVNYIVKNRIVDVADIVGFERADYRYKAELSDAENYVFTRGYST